MKMETPTAAIREYRPDDAPAVERCLAELQDFSKLIFPQMADGAVAPQYLRHLLAYCGETKGKIFVVEHDARIVGMVCVFARIKSSAPDEDRYEYAYVSDLVVLADYRDMGFGRALLKRAENHARSEGATLLRINVLAKNEVARKLYIADGFDKYLVSLQKRLG